MNGGPGRRGHLHDLSNLSHSMLPWFILILFSQILQWCSHMRREERNCVSLDRVD